MIRKGKMIYVPPNVLDVTDNIMQMNGRQKRSEAFEDLTKYAKVGIEAEKIYKLDFAAMFRKKGRV